MKRLLAAVAAVVLPLTATAPLAAQNLVSGIVHFGVMGGATYPISDLKSISSSGWNAGVLMNVGLPLVPIGFRIDGSWNQFGDRTYASPGGGGSATSNLRVIDGTADGTYNIIGAFLPTKVYLIGGVGLYNVRNRFTTSFGGPAQTSSATKFGVNAGAGVRAQLGGLTAFVEARWHDIFGGNDTGTGRSSAQMVPISVGLTF